MSIVHDPEPQKPTPLDNAIAPEPSSGGSAPAELAARWLYTDDIPDGPPVEPDVAAETLDHSQVRDALLRFHLYGQRPVDGGHASMPALLYPYRDLTRVRYEYPVCVNGKDPTNAFRPLTSLIDSVLAGATEEGDTLERLNRDIYRLEVALKKGAAAAPDKTLSKLWDEASTELLDSDRINGDHEQVLRDHLDNSKKTLPVGGRLVGCDSQTASLLFIELADLHWQLKSKAWAHELDALIGGLRDTLGADEHRSVQARSPEHLREAVADPEVDSGAMSSLIGASAGQRIPESRRHRIEQTLATLVGARPLFADGSGAHGTSIDVKAAVTTCSSALEEHQARMAAIVDFFKAVHVARLELDNRYREHIHDEHFAGFNAAHLTEDEFALCPPVLLRLPPDSLTNEEAGRLLDLLGSGTPIKVLVEIDDVTGESRTAGPSVAVWATRIARAAVALGDVYVSQSPVSRVACLHSQLVGGLAFAGPALFSVYVGNTKPASELSTYLKAEAAAESRLFPVFTFDPAKGDTCADRMEISDNSCVDDDWPVESVRYLANDSNEATIDLAFTPADYLVIDRRFDKQFWHVDRSYWHKDMLPLADYLEQGLMDTDSAIPYIMTVDRSGRLQRTVVTRTVMATAFVARSSWRNLQENGGIKNSFAQRLLSEEKMKLVEEKQREIAEIEQNYAAQLDQDIGDLTKEIVQRIVGRLLSGETVSTPLPATPIADEPPRRENAPGAAPTPTTETQPEYEDEVDDDIGSFDDPYIDTPLCTTCNECTQLNALVFAYNENKQAYIKDATAGPYQDIVKAAELCPVHIIHPGKPNDPDEPGLAEWIERAAPFN